MILNHTQQNLTKNPNIKSFVNDVTFDGQSYSARQKVSPSQIIEFEDTSTGVRYLVTSFNFSNNSTNNEARGDVDAMIWVGDVPPNNATLKVIAESNPVDA